MPSGRQRTSANAPDTSTVSVNEKILKECHDLYTEKEKGIKLSCLNIWQARDHDVEINIFRPGFNENFTLFRTCCHC